MRLRLRLKAEAAHAYSPLPPQSRLREGRWGAAGISPAAPTTAQSRSRARLLTAAAAESPRGSQVGRKRRMRKPSGRWRGAGSRARLGTISAARRTGVLDRISHRGKSRGLDPVRMLFIGQGQQDGWRRAGVMLLALIQLAVVGIIPTADATLAMAAVHEPVPVDTVGPDPVETPHDHTRCPLCSFLAAAGEVTPAATQPGSVAPKTSLPQHLESHPDPSTQQRWAGHGPRAPPTA